MSERKIRHVEDVFGGGQMNGVEPHHKPQNILDRKSSFNMFKNKQAPKPPQGQVPLPKIGDYQPKILMEKKPVDIEPPTHKMDSHHEHRHRDHSHDHVINNNAVSAPIIIGDKDIPLRLEHQSDEEPPVPAPRRKRRAPPVPESETKNSEPGTNNPIFGRSVSQRSDEERLEMDIEEQGGDIDFGPGIDNPAFNSRERNASGISRDRSESSSSWVEEQHRRIQEEHQNREKGISFPYIPPPDYEDEEMTMDFDEDYEPVADYDKNTAGYRSSAAYRESAGYRGSAVHRELEGDDFGKYMQEEDYEFDAPKRPMRRPHPGAFYQRAKPAQKTSKVIDKKAVKAKKKHAPDPNMKRNTIRDFTFSDSKIGWGDRTVKSTSAKGRYIKHNKERQRIDHPETFAKKESPGSYEEFLRVKNGIPLESPNSSDSGVDTNEERNHRNMFYHSQPKQLRHEKYEQKPSVWQRLTWKFRKNPNAHRIIESERL